MKRTRFDFAKTEPDPAALACIPEGHCRRLTVLGVGFDGETLLVACADPSDIMVSDDVQTITGRRVRTLSADADELRKAISRLARIHLDAEAEEEIDGAEGLIEASEAPISRLVKDLIARAAIERASDIHVEPGENDVRIRFRIDGVLHEMTRISKTQHRALISRLKVLASLDITERRLPQDGRFSTSADASSIDLRVATLPSVFGEKAVLRLLDKGVASIGLSQLGFDEHTLKSFREAFSRPHGTILVTGPTGSGKSTTLYSTLGIIADPSKNVITVEDPVEYKMENITQMQVNVKANLTFARCLRSILRADPDIVMVGEIRDSETAQICMEAALTGHLVLSSLHTNDAPSAPIRLVEMGVGPYLVASAVSCVLAQRLARKLCVSCKKAYSTDAELRKLVGVKQIFGPVGCPACSGTGYNGRVALSQVMPVSEQIAHMIAMREPTDRISALAASEGMGTLLSSGLRCTAEGTTSIEEVYRVVF